MSCWVLLGFSGPPVFFLEPGGRSTPNLGPAILTEKSRAQATEPDHVSAREASARRWAESHPPTVPGQSTCRGQAQGHMGVPRPASATEHSRNPGPRAWGGSAGTPKGTRRQAERGDPPPSAELTSLSVTRALSRPRRHTAHTRRGRGQTTAPGEALQLPLEKWVPQTQRGWGDPPFFPPCTCPKPKHSHHGRGFREPCGGRTPSPRGAAVTLQCETDPVALALSPPPGSCAGVRGVWGYRPGRQKDTGASWEIEEPEFGSVPPPTHSVTQRK